MRNRDVFMDEIERLSTVIAKLLLQKSNLPKLALVIEINTAYTNLFDLNSKEISLTNPKIIALLTLEGDSKLNEHKINTLIELIELDVASNGLTHAKQEVLFALVKKTIAIGKTYSIELNNKLMKYHL